MEMHQKRVYRIALGMLGNHEEAADIVQEVFVRAFRSLKRFRARSSLATWLHRIALNLCISELRKRRIRRQVGLSFLSDRLLSKRGRPSLEFERKTLLWRIRKAVDSLPPRQKAVFIMRQEEEMSHAEIAETLRLSEGAVRSSYFQALKKLRKELGSDD